MFGVSNATRAHAMDERVRDGMLQRSYPRYAEKEMSRKTYWIPSQAYLILICFQIIHDSGFRFGEIDCIAGLDLFNFLVGKISPLYPYGVVDIEDEWMTRAKHKKKAY